jgi:hypothetical protein
MWADDYTMQMLFFKGRGGDAQKYLELRQKTSGRNRHYTKMNSVILYITKYR